MDTSFEDDITTQIRLPVNSAVTRWAAQNARIATDIMREVDDITALELADVAEALSRLAKK